MKISMDKAGRIVVPKPLRRRFGFGPGIELEVVEQPGGVLLSPINQGPTMVKVDGLWIHQGTAEPEANWERIVDEVREERTQAVLKT